MGSSTRYGADGDRADVWVERDGVRRNLTHHVHHSPDGHSWGYGGSGPSELARDILWEHLGHEPEPKLYQEFKAEFITGLVMHMGWVLPGSYIDDWLRER